MLALPPAIGQTHVQNASTTSTHQIELVRYSAMGLTDADLILHPSSAERRTSSRLMKNRANPLFYTPTLSLRFQPLLRLPFKLTSPTVGKHRTCTDVLSYP